MLEVCHLDKTYTVGDGEATVLHDINLGVLAGEFVSIMGPSGSGKSTLMHILGCLDVPTKGQYRLRGRPVESLTHSELARIRNEEVGFVFQNFHLLPRMTVLRNVELPMVYAGIPANDRHRRAIKLLQQVGLGDRLQHRPNTLSGGQKQRVAVARALANHPSVLLADEPTGSLDTKTGEEIMGMFQTLNQGGVTVVVITHDAKVAAFAQRTVQLLDGKIVGEEGLR
ncbi:ABC transporter ATP-binding protein [Alicyclobacillaceae bacterium I2511]|nr:ABC transporter ATP-binding protein [Alicyclobacillaceae bacterium I2511]